jgi:hypothetical protein
MASNHGPRRDAAKHRFWEECVTRWRKSGLSVREFCRREALAEPSFYGWRRELARRETGEHPSRQPARPQSRRVAKRTTFLPVEVVAANFAAPAAGLEIVLPRGRRVRVRPGFDRLTLEAVLDILERRPC